jgi:hypothetical protein
MNKILLLLLTGLLSTGLFAQNDLEYDFSVLDKNYSDLENPIPLSGSQNWDDPAYVAPLGFDFEIGNQSFQNLEKISSIGVVISAGEIFSSGDTLPIMSLMDFDLISRTSANGGSSSPISYKTTGSPGNRIFKWEWKNAGFFEGLESEFINFQLWVFEADNSIEFHYGPQNINGVTSDNGNPGPMVFFVPLFETSQNGDEQFLSPLYYLEGDPTNPNLITLTNPDPSAAPPGSLDQMPPDGTVYRFEPTSLSVEFNQKLSLKLFPNPTSDFLTIKSEVTVEKVGVFNLLGQKLIESSCQNKISVENLQAGVYLLKIETSQGAVTRRFVKK